MRTLVTGLVDRRRLGLNCRPTNRRANKREHGRPTSWNPRCRQTNRSYCCCSPSRLAFYGPVRFSVNNNKIIFFYTIGRDL